MTKALTFPFSHRSLPVHLRMDQGCFENDRLGSASCSPPSRLLPASASGCLPCSAGLLELPWHHHPWHCWLVPLGFPVHLNLGRGPVDEAGLAAQSRQGFSVDLFKLEFKCAFVFVSNLLRMANCKVFCKCILAIYYGCLHEF